MEKAKKKRISWVFWSIFLVVGVLLFLFYLKPLEIIIPWGKLGIVFWALAVIFGAMIVSKIFSVLLMSRLKELAKSSHIKLDITRFRIFEHLVSLAIYSLAFIYIVYSVPELRALSISILAGVGFAAIIVGFAAKEVLSNLLSGIFIAVFQPLRVGDRIRFEGEYGTVEDITLRHTIIKTWKNIRLVVPNSAINKATITNYSIVDEKCLETIDMPISYDSSIDKAKKIMIEEAKKHKDFFNPHSKGELVSKKEPIKVRVTGLGDYFVNLRLYFWAKNKPTAFRMSCDLRESIKKRFDREGIEIPFPYRTIVYKRELKKKKN